MLLYGNIYSMYHTAHAGILEATADPDLRLVIGRDGHLDQSQAWDLGLRILAQ